MKTCSGCKEDKPVDEFGRNAKRKDGLQSYCKPCRRAYDRNRYLTTDRPAKAKANAVRWRKEMRESIMHYLEKGCVDCSNTDPRVLQFDHIDPATKLANVSKLLTTGASKERIEAEIAKCVVRCANCHQIRTGQQFGWWSAV